MKYILSRNAVFALVGITLYFGGCVSGKYTAEEAFKNKQYSEAAELFQKELKEVDQDSLAADIAFKIGQSYEYINDVTEARKWYQTAISKKYGPEAIYHYANMLKKEERYPEAISEFERYAELYPAGGEQAHREIEGAKLAAEWKDNPNNFQVTIADKINTKNTDYAPMFFKNKLVFSSHKEKSLGKKLYGWTGEKFSDLYICDVDDQGNLSTPVPFDEKSGINTKFHEGASTFSSDSTEMYFTRCGTKLNGKESLSEDFCKIFHSRILPDGAWSEPQKIMLFDKQDSIKMGHPSLSIDGQRLYFAAEKNDGYGGKDIYVVTKEGESWGTPINLGPQINTAGNDMFPYIHTNGKLYFSSDGHLGMGGLDIFIADNSSSGWTVSNLKYPVNSGGDDFAITLRDKELINESGYYETVGFFTSNRPKSGSGDDIYKFNVLREAYYLLNVAVLTRVHQNPDDRTSRVIDFEPLQSKVSIYRNDTLIEDLESDSLGILRYNIKPNTEYKIVAAHQDHLNKSEYVQPISYKSETGIITVDMQLVLEKKIGQDEMLNIRNIYYDFDKWYIREDAAKELDSLSRLLKDNPHITKIEIGSHTDSRGSFAYNEKLSQKRADAAIEYLTTKGVDPKRLVAKGYGESELVNGCHDGVECSEYEHQRNRRTTFRILGQDINQKSVEPEEIVVNEAPAKTTDKKEIADKRPGTPEQNIPPQNKNELSPTKPLPPPQANRKQAQQQETASKDNAIPEKGTAKKENTPETSTRPEPATSGNQQTSKPSGTPETPTEDATPTQKEPASYKTASPEKEIPAEIKSSSVEKTEEQWEYIEPEDVSSPAKQPEPANINKTSEKPGRKPEKPSKSNTPETTDNKPPKEAAPEEKKEDNAPPGNEAAEKPSIMLLTRFKEGKDYYFIIEHPDSTFSTTVEKDIFKNYKDGDLLNYEQKGRKYNIQPKEE